MSGLLKWGPLVGSAALVAAAVLEATGQAGLAAAIRTLGGLLGSSIPVGEIGAAVLAGTGVIRKLIAEYKRISAL